MRFCLNKYLGFLVLCGGLLWGCSGGAAEEPEDHSKEAGKEALTFPFSYIGEGLGNTSGGYRRGATYEGLLTVGVQGDLSKLLGWEGGSFLVNGLYPHGRSLTDCYVHDYNRVSNIDAYDSVRLYEAWLQQEGGGFSIRAGQLLADTEFSGSTNAAQFVNSAFGLIPVLARNFHAPTFPVTAAGVRVRYEASEKFSFQAGLFDGDPGDGERDNRHGVDWTLNTVGGALVLAEATLTPWKDGPTYKAGGFFRSPAENEDFPESGRRGDMGGYWMADQPLWHQPGSKDGGLNAFARIGFAPASRNAVPFYCDGGLTWKGLIPGREEDIAGLACSCSHFSSALRDEAGEPPTAHHETILEATYKCAIREWLSVQPDMQYVFNPGGKITQSNALVAGVRFALTF